MNKRTILTLVGIAVLVTGGFILIRSNRGPEARLKAENKKVEAYASSVERRVDSAVITLDQHGVYQLKNGFAIFPGQKISDGSITLDGPIVTSFIESTDPKKSPRLDALVHTAVDEGDGVPADYVTLFQDRGDIALEKSHIFIGHKALVQSIRVLPPEAGTDQEYQVNIVYLVRNAGEDYAVPPTSRKEVTLMVIDGHFSETVATTIRDVEFE